VTTIEDIERLYARARALYGQSFQIHVTPEDLRRTWDPGPRIVAQACLGISHYGEVASVSGLPLQDLGVVISLMLRKHPQATKAERGAGKYGFSS
jgi:hypothetical protein